MTRLSDNNLKKKIIEKVFVQIDFLKKYREILSKDKLSAQINLLTDRIYNIMHVRIHKGELCDNRDKKKLQKFHKLCNKIVVFSRNHMIDLDSVKKEMLKISN